MGDLLPVGARRGTVQSHASVQTNLGLRTFGLSGALMTDDNRIHPSFSSVRAGYGAASGPRYQPRTLVTSRGAEAARSARSMPRSGAGGKKEILCAIGVDVD